jgi:hypothetical protein
MYTGRRVLQLTSYDVNPDPTGQPGDETWEIEEAVNISEHEMAVIKSALSMFRDTTLQCITDYAGIRGHREEIVEMLGQMETVQELSDKLNLQITRY